MDPDFSSDHSDAFKRTARTAELLIASGRKVLQRDLGDERV